MIDKPFLRLRLTAFTLFLLVYLWFKPKTVAQMFIDADNVESGRQDIKAIGAMTLRRERLVAQKEPPECTP